jgi:hypothetical protein
MKGGALPKCHFPKIATFYPRRHLDTAARETGAIIVMCGVNAMLRKCHIEPK